MTDGAGPARGLQVERTELAWVRTALACGALALASTHVAAGTASRLAAVVAGCVVAAMGLAAAAHRLGYLRRHRRPAATPRVAAALLATAVVAADLLAVALLLG